MKVKPWRPEHRESCPDCGHVLFITSVLIENGQVNFACINEECDVTGFVLESEFFYGE